MKLKSLTDTFLITNTPSINEADTFVKSLTDTSPIILQWRSWRVWQTRSWSPILPPLMKLKSLTDTFLITNTPSINEAEILTDTFLITNTTSINEAEEFDRHVLDHQYSLQWRSWRVWQTRSWSPILPPLMKLKFWQTRSWSPIMPPLKKLKSLTDTFFITNTPSIDEVEEFDRRDLDHKYTIHWRSWRVSQTRPWEQIIPPLKKLKSLTDTFLITNTPCINEAEEFDRHVLDHQYSLH